MNLPYMPGVRRVSPAGLPCDPGRVESGVRKRFRFIALLTLAVFMAVNMGVSALAMARYDARTSGVEAATPLAVFLDAHFDNARMERIYPNAKKVEKAE